MADRFGSSSVERPGKSEGLEELLSLEAVRGVHCLDFYSDFRDRTEAIRQRLTEILAGIRTEGARVVAYGAAAKGTTFLQFMDLDVGDLGYVVDANPRKHGWVMPGALLPIEPPEKLYQDRPDYVLILAWNFADEIMQQLAKYSAEGGRFIVPIPEPRISVPEPPRS